MFARAARLKVFLRRHTLMLRISEAQDLPSFGRQLWLPRRCYVSPLWICFVYLCALAMGISCLPAQTNSTPPSSTSATQLFDRGVAQAQKGDSNGAIRTLEEALQSDPSSATILDAIGSAYSMKGDFRI